MKPRPPSRTRMLQRELVARLEEVEAVCLELRAFLAANGLAADSFAVELIARECLNNAVIHGSRGQARKKVRLHLRLGRRWLRLQIADEGPGFNWRLASRSAPEITATHRRGLSISNLYADRVAFNRRGNQITLWMENRNTAKRHQHGNIHA